MDAVAACAPEPLHAFVQRRRHELGLKRHEFATLTGLSPAGIGLLERERPGGYPTIPTLIAIARVLDTDPLDLVARVLSPRA